MFLPREYCFLIGGNKMKAQLSVLLTLVSLASYAADIQLKSNSLYHMTMSFKASKAETKLETLTIGLEKFGRLAELAAPVQNERIGQPEIPRIHKWVAIDPSAKYQVVPTFSNPIVYKNVTLYPVQPDTLDNGQKLPFLKSERAYSEDAVETERVEVGKPMQLGAATLLPITLVPAKFDPAKRELTVYQSADVKIVAENPTDSTVANTKLTQFATKQLSELALNGSQYVSLVNRVKARNYMILYPQRFERYAKKLGDRYRKENVSIFYSEVKAESKPEDVKKLIQEQYTRTGLDNVLLFGNEKDIPLQSIEGTVGDFYYSLLSGTDEISDAAVGRLPASTTSQAELIVNKILRYKELQSEGQTNKKVALVAHAEEYPGKYTANQENIIKSPNPRHFDFTAIYGGAGKKNQDVIDAAQSSYSIINYRGHGSNDSWIEWDAEGKSFDSEQVDKMPNDISKLPFIFNVACDNGSIQLEAKTLVEKQLFPSEDPHSLIGAVATFGATEPSYTSVNHDFDLNLFKYLEESDDLSIGNIYTLANNKLTQDAGGTAPVNVKMYVLYADPLLAPRLLEEQDAKSR